MKISFICPGRNNWKYFKWSYESIRKNQGNHDVEICFADDHSDQDNTWEHVTELAKNDPKLKIHKNDTGKRLGHTILYDKLVNDYATHDVCIIWHCDMYLCPGALDEIEKYIEPGKIVSLTRIEPPLHPPGPEKLLQDFGTEPEHFKEKELLEYVDYARQEFQTKTTEGIFAPWAFMKEDFQEIGGHDPLYAPQSKEDSDIFNRFHLIGVEFIQTWAGLVYHMTCRGSRFNPTLTTPGTNSNEWEAQNLRSTRNFIRKWGHFVKHDPLMKPIVPPKYLVNFHVSHCTYQLLEALEPWCTKIYVENIDGVVDRYIENEQKNTKFNLHNRVIPIEIGDGYNPYDITVHIDGNKFTNMDFQYIQQLSEILADSGEIGEFQIGSMKVEILGLAEYQNSLIPLKNNHLWSISE